jgi:hypothetical protein
MKKIRCGKVNLYDVGTKVYDFVDEIWPDSESVAVICRPRRCPDIEIYVTPVPKAMVVNVDYMRWVKSQVENETLNLEAPRFVVPEIADLLVRINMFVQAHGGDSITPGPRRKAGGGFIFWGPLLSAHYLNEYVEKAAKKAGLSYAEWKKFWTRNSELIESHMSEYVDTFTSDDWRW